MRDSRREIGDALADSGRTDRETALRVLGCAVRWAADTLDRPAPVSGDGTPDADADGADALNALYALDDALTDARDLAAALPGLLEAARPGEGVGRRTTDLMDELTAAAERVASQRAALEELAAKEDELRRRLAEHEELRQQVGELRRLERLVAELDELQAQRETVDTRLRELRDRDPGAVDRDLRTAAGDLLRLTERQLAVLEPSTRQTLERAAAAQEALTATERRLNEGSRRLAADQDRLKLVQAKQDKVFASLTRYAQADRELTTALRAAAGADTGPVPGQGLTLEDVEDLTRAIEQRLVEADQVLSRTLTDRQGAEEDGGTKITGVQP
ncbi:hypothetical protein ACGFYV_04615 [Streptomyces sp. NPDC048297]|uniref:hypothetical protein n=1 Tax=Streptomyces sp. NPDC048297 TaxID=3365531 RepID=UPI00371F04DD